MITDLDRLLRADKRLCVRCYCNDDGGVDDEDPEQEEEDAMPKLNSDCVRITTRVAVSRVPPAFAKPMVRHVFAVLVMTQLCASAAYAQSCPPISDPLFCDQWPLDNRGQSGGTSAADIDIVAAWGITEGGPNAEGDKIAIAVIDSGFHITHEDIDFWKNDIELNGVVGIDDDNNTFTDDTYGWNVDAGNGTPQSDLHGTFVAGIAAAVGNDLGVSGVNRNATVVPIQIDAGYPEETPVLEAYRYVTRLRAQYDDPDKAGGAYIVVANSSFGVSFPYGDPVERWAWCDAYDEMGDLGILSVASVDNADHDVDVELGVPDSCDSEFLITVTNTDHDDLKKRDSDGGGPDIGAAWSATHVDLAAPGTNLFSTLPPDDGYGWSTGTSFAAPHVAGAIALMHAAAPPSLVQQYKVDPGPVALQFKNALLDNVDPIAELATVGGAYPTVTGGRLNVHKAVEAIVNWDTDGDGVKDTLDNCWDDVNSYQDDTDRDGCGNVCDADYDNNGLVDFGDFGEILHAFGSTDEEKCHVESITGCIVDFGDFGYTVSHFGAEPGPSGTTAGTTACP